MARKIILDVDTGSDDAVAIMTAILSKDVDVVGICSVAGNQPIDNTTENSLRVVQALGAHVPVYRGAREPLVKTMFPDRFVKGEKIVNDRIVDKDGNEVKIHRDYLDLPKAENREEDISAAEFYLKYLREAKEKITLVLVGPLTNFALALMIDNSIVKKVEEIVIMGGGHHITNSTSSAEFNIWYDPEAAHKVINCGAKVTLVPLDATHEACVTEEDCVALDNLGTLAGKFASELCRQRILIHNARQPLDIPDAAAVHDALCIAYLIDPNVLSDIRHVHVDIGIRDRAEGQTIIDQRYYTEDKNCYFAYHADRHRFVEILLNTLGQ